MNINVTIDGRFAKRAAVALLCAGILAGTVSACDVSPDTPTAQSQGQALTEQAYKQQSAAVPYPADQLRDSLERRNLREKLLRYNNPSKISYLYLLSNTGTVYAYYTIKGKVSSNQSQMTTDQFTIDCNDGAGCSDTVVNAPGDDGSYGANEAGQFAFTTDGVMVTWDTPYILADAPMKINGGTTLAYIDGSKPTSTAAK